METFVSGFAYIMKILAVSLGVTFLFAFTVAFFLTVILELHSNITRERRHRKPRWTRRSAIEEASWVLYEQRNVDPVVQHVTSPMEDNELRIAEELALHHELRRDYGIAYFTPEELQRAREDLVWLEGMTTKHEPRYTKRNITGR